MRFLRLFSLFSISIVIVNSASPTNSISKYPIPPLILNDAPDDVNFRVIKFDPSKLALGLNITQNGYGVSKAVNNGVWSLAVSEQVFSNGKHYFHYQINKSAPDVLIGIYDGSSPIALFKSFYPYAKNGVSYGSSAGYIYYQSTYVTFGSIIQLYDVVGVYLNFDMLTITYFLNDQLIGSAKFQPDIKYYASVSIQGAIEVISLGFN